MIPKDIGVDNKIVKYKRMIRKCALNIQVWLENNTEPTQDDMAKRLGKKSRVYVTNEIPLKMLNRSRFETWTGLSDKSE